ncbi:Stigma-specific STIG1-like protein 4 [Linum grandiflorum]
MQAPIASLTSTLFSPIILLLLLELASGDSVSQSSPWLNKVSNHHRPREPGCRDQEGINHHDPPGRPRMRCCRNQCVDVSSDINNCGLCGIRCPFSWLCCGGLCVNTNVSPFNCGRCFNRCPWGVQCAFGMCGYGAQHQPPFPFPPRHPDPRHPDPWPRHPQPPCPPGEHSSGIVTVSQ